MRTLKGFPVIYRWSTHRNLKMRNHVTRAFSQALKYVRKGVNADTLWSLPQTGCGFFGYEAQIFWDIRLVTSLELKPWKYLTVLLWRKQLIACIRCYTEEFDCLTARVTLLRTSKVIILNLFSRGKKERLPVKPPRVWNKLLNCESLNKQLSFRKTK